MNLLKLIQFLRDRLKTVIWISCAVLALVVVLDSGLLEKLARAVLSGGAIPAIVDKEHAHTAVEHWPAFWAAFGFLGCVVIILFSKWFGHLGIMTREDYYEDGESSTQTQLAGTGGARPSPGAATSESGGALGHSSAPGKSKPAAPEDGRTPNEGHHD
jgi:hypothetical protein